MGQEIPAEFYLFKSYVLNQDIGQNWDQITSIGGPRYSIIKTDNFDQDSLYIDLRGGVYKLKDATAIYGFSRFRYKKYFYGYLYPRVVNDPSKFSRYSGIPRDITRGSFNSGETDLSGIGFQNNWAYFQIGRGRESIGAGNDINLALSYNSPPYDYIMLGSDYGKLRVKYIHGFLESSENFINRYITARAFEFTNKKNIVISFSEVIIYSGEKRPIDFSYLNPISTHLEVELNDKLNFIGDSDANAIWQGSIDWLINKRIRFSGNLLFDEFVLDNSELNEGKEHGRAFSTRLSYSSLIYKEIYFTLFTYYVNVGTPTFRHGNGYNNLVQRSKALGYENGSDLEDISIGLNFFNKKNIIINFKYLKHIQGEESILERPYEKYANYIKDDFPSGNLFIQTNKELNIQYWFRKNASIIINYKLLNESGKNRVKSFNFGLDLFFPKKITI